MLNISSCAFPVLPTASAQKYIWSKEIKKPSWFVSVSNSFGVQLVRSLMTKFPLVEICCFVGAISVSTMISSERIFFFKSSGLSGHCWHKTDTPTWIKKFRFLSWKSSFWPNSASWKRSKIVLFQCWMKNSQTSKTVAKQNCWPPDSLNVESFLFAFWLLNTLSFTFSYLFLQFWVLETYFKKAEILVYSHDAGSRALRKNTPNIKTIRVSKEN